jgi:hypothetical protein
MFIWDNVSETGLCLRPQVKKSTVLGPADRASPYFRKIEGGFIDWVQRSSVFLSVEWDIVRSPERRLK